MHCMLIALALAAPLAALAQARADPADAKAAVPALRYDSALAGYRGFREEKPAPWKQVNDAVKGSGGHAAHGSPTKETPSDAPRKPAEPSAKPSEHKH